MSWYLKEKLQKLFATEKGSVMYAPGSREGFALVYPNTYHVGMSNLGFQIIYQQINSRGDTACERLFMPDRKDEEEYIRTGTPLMTIETQRHLYEFPLIGFALTFEMDYFNFLKILSMGKVPLLSAERTEDHPLVIIGGPCATFNPEPLADFVDVCIIGEGEETIHDVLDCYYQGRSIGLSRDEILLNFASIKGVYVPKFYQPVYQDDGTLKALVGQKNVPQSIQRRWVKELEKYQARTVIITPDTEFGEMYLIEVARGCGRHCRFCMAGYCFRRPRVRSLQTVLDAVQEAKKHNLKVGLMGAAISDYPYINELCTVIQDLKMRVSVASLRADSLTDILVQALAASGQRTITLAPEAASSRMRKIINKGITNEHLYHSIALAVQAGIPNVRLYIMVGLPFEEMSDVEEIVDMARDIKQYMEKLGSKGMLTLSVNPFIPKPFTPFQWLPIANMTEVENRLHYLQNKLKKIRGIEVLVESPKESYIQAILARGDRRIAPVLLTSLEKGGKKGFKQAMKKYNLDEAYYLYRNRPETEVLPWQHLQMGFSANYLLQEFANAQEERYTSPCADSCIRCGVCK